MEINGESAYIDSNDSSVYYISKNAPYDYENIKVAFKKDGNTVKTQIVEKVNDVTMISDYRVVVTEDLPGIIIKENDQQDENEPIDFGRVNNLRFNLNVSSLVTSPERRSESDTGLAGVTLNIRKKSDDTQVTYVEFDGSTCTKETPDGNDYSVTIMSENGKKFSESDSPVNSQDITIVINDPETGKALEDGEYIGTIKASNNAGNSSEKAFIFTIDKTAPEAAISLIDQDNAVTVGDYRIFDQNGKFAIKVSGLTSDRKEDTLSFTLTKDGETLDSPSFTTEWSDENDGSVCTVSVEKEGFYNLMNVTVTDECGNKRVYSSDEQKPLLSFAVDKDEPTITVEYDDPPITSQLLRMLSFGLYHNTEINAKITVSDKISGVNPDSVQVINNAADGQAVNVSFSDIEDNHRVIAGKVSLDNDVPYNLTIIAKDLFNRQDKSNTVVITPDGIVTDNDNKEIARTDDIPSIDAGTSEAAVINSDYSMEFTAISDAEGEGANSGLKSVKAEVFYLGTDKVDNNNDFSADEYETVAVLTDNGSGSIEKTNDSVDNIEMVRLENADVDFKLKKTESCKYQINVKINTEANGSLRSGNYAVRITTENNVINSDLSNQNSTIVKAFEVDLVPPDTEFSYEVLGKQKNTFAAANGYAVYDDGIKITATVKDYNLDADALNSSADMFKYSVKDSTGNDIGDYSFGTWTSEIEEDGLIISKAEMIIDSEGFYEFVPSGIKDLVEKGNESNLTGKNYKFAVDKTEARTEIVYEEPSVTSQLLSMLTFGLYRDQTIKVKVTVIDEIAGVNADSINIVNCADGVEEKTGISNWSFETTSDYENKIAGTFILNRNVPYKLIVTARDNLNREYGSNSSETEPSEIVDDNQNPIKEIVSTDKKPYVQITSQVADWSKDNVVIEFDAASMKPESDSLADSGLRLVTAKLQYAESKSIYNAGKWTTVATITDDGKVISTQMEGNQGFIEEDIIFERTDKEYKPELFSTKKQSQMSYILTVKNSFEGYYRLLLTVTNNVIANGKNDVYYSSDCATEFGIDLAAPKLELTYDNYDNNTVANHDYYKKQRTLTFTLDEISYNLDDVKNLFKSVITETSPERKIDLDWIEKSPGLFVGTYTFKDDGNLENDGHFKLEIQDFYDSIGNSAVWDDDSNFEGYTEEFTIDTTEPEIFCSFTGGGNKNGEFYDADRILTVEVKEHNLSADELNNSSLNYRILSIIEEYSNGSMKAKESNIRLNFSDNGENSFIASCIFSDSRDNANDGRYSVRINNIEDRAGNSASNFKSVNEVFVIDTTNPLISISYRDTNTLNINNVGFDYYRTNVMYADITVTEHNFDPSANVSKYQMVDINGNNVSQKTINVNSWVREGNISKATVKLEGDARFTYFSFETTDRAKRKAQSDPDKRNFVLDKTAPSGLRITYSTDPFGLLKEVLTFGCYRSSVNVIVEADDNCAGIYQLKYRYVGINDSKSGEGVFTFDKEQLHNRGTFTINAQFKGTIELTAIDYSGNTAVISTGDSSEGIIVDDIDPRLDKVAPVLKVNESSSPRNEIFDGDVTMKVDVRDPVIDNVSSGIDRIEYTIKDNLRSYTEGPVVIKNPSGSNTFETSFVIDSNRFNSNEVEVTVVAYDNSLNSVRTTRNIKIDITKPTIDIVYDNNQPNVVDGIRYYNRNRTATITVTERNFDEADVTYAVINNITNMSNAPVPVMTQWVHNVVPSDPDKSTHIAKIVYSDDGDYVFDFSFIDMAGNAAAKVSTDKFTVDKTMPRISVSYDNNDSQNSNYYKAGRTATVAVNEHNFRAGDIRVFVSATEADNKTSIQGPSLGSWTHNGDIHTAKLSFEEDGYFRFTVEYTDPAQNKATSFDSGDFYIDKVSPSVSIRGVENNKAYGESVTFEINFDDINYDGNFEYSINRIDVDAKTGDVTDRFQSNITVSDDKRTIVCGDFERILENEGIYILSASCTDNAGNRNMQSVKFSVNRFGSTYELGKETIEFAGKCINLEQDVVIREINVDPIDVVDLTCVKNGEIIPLNRDEDYTVSISGDENTWYIAEYVIKSSCFSGDGTYSVKIVSQDSKLDNKKNSNMDADEFSEDQNTKLMVAFVVDKTAPLVTLSGIDDGVLYEEGSRNLTINLEDFNLDENKLVVKVGDKVFEYDHFDSSSVLKTGSGVTVNFEIKSSDFSDYIDVEVSVVDKAGNVGKATRTHFKLSASPIERFFANITLVIIVFGTAIALVIMLVIIIAKRKKKKS